MALETLKGVEEIGGFKVAHYPDHRMNKTFIAVIAPASTITFKIQDGPIKENGVNGCQVDTLIHAARDILNGLNAKFPSSYNRGAIDNLDLAIRHLEERTKDREARGVEGHSKA